MIQTPRYYRTDTSHRWIFSYADILTVLLVLFVAISAQGLHKADARTRPAVPPRSAAPVDRRADLRRVQRILERQGLNPRLESRGLVISLPQAVLFPSGEDRVIPSALPVVAEIADAIREIPNRVTLAGYADAVPIHNRRFRDNWVLSAARGLSLLEILGTRYGIPQERLAVAGYGSNSPRGPNDTADNRALNRRVEIVILNEGAP